MRAQPADSTPLQLPVPAPRSRWNFAFVCCVLSLASCTERTSSPAPRNLLMVVFDTTRADHLGCYGYHRRPTSPTLDALAAEGVLFEQAYSASSLTPISAGSFLSGSLPYHHGVRSLFVVGEETLARDVPSLFELLRLSGRATAGFVSAKPMGRQYGLGRGFELYEDDMIPVKAAFNVERFADAPQRPGDMTCDLAIAWLRQQGAQPFAAFVHLFDAHDSSFVPPSEFLAEHSTLQLAPELGRYWPQSPLKNLADVLELYDAEIRFMDLQLRRLLDTLDELGVREETLIVFLADHGESFGEHGYYTHGWLSEEELRVPIVLAGAGLDPGTRLKARTRTIDLLPSVCELFGIEVPAGVDGESVLSLLRGAHEEFPRDVYAEVQHAPRDPRGREAAMYTVIEGRWKYIHRPASKAHELYNLKRDPAESNNRLAFKPRVAARLLGKLIERGALGSQAVSLDGLTPAQLRELQALGYLGELEDE